MAHTNGTIQYNLRITETMRNRLKQSAKENERTLNAEINARLEQSYLPANQSGEFTQFMDFLDLWLECLPADGTSEVLAKMVNAWKAKNKKPTA